MNDRENDMQTVRGLAVACAALLLAGGQALGDAKEDAEKALLGKWQHTEKDGDGEITAKVEFKKGGVVTTQVSLDGMELTTGEGTYKVIDAKTLESTVKTTNGTMTSTQTWKLRFQVKGDTLELTGESNMPQKFTRIK
jgi:uncharacterized protein (TIGR03066 family)